MCWVVRFFRDVDRDHDGSISKRELSEFVAENGLKLDYFETIFDEVSSSSNGFEVRNMSSHSRCKHQQQCMQLARLEKQSEQFNCLERRAPYFPMNETCDMYDLMEHFQEVWAQWLSLHTSSFSSLSTCAPRHFPLSSSLSLLHRA